jgi:hypothetical protein
MKITHIVFDNDPSLFTDNDNIILIIGGNKIYKANLRLLTLLNTVNKYNDKYIIPLEIIPIEFISLVFMEVSLQININDAKFKKINLLVECYYLESRIRQSFAALNHEQKYKEPYTIISKKINSKTANFIIDMWHKIDEYYLECDISNIESIKIGVYNFTKQQEINHNFSELLNYDYTMINLHLNKINNKLLQIPINTKKIKSLFSDMFSVIPDTTRQSFIININFFNPENKIKLHTFNYNVNRYNSGVSVPAYNISFKYYLELVYQDFEINNIAYNGKTIYITDNIETIKNFNFNNIQDNLLELKIKNPLISLTNLPFNLKKLTVCNKSNDIEIKVPFGCKYTEKVID